MNKYSEYNFEVQAEQWSKPPADGVGYIQSNHIIKMNRGRLMAFVERFEGVRFDLNRWRNAGNGWRQCMGLDITEGKHIFDYGCGFGIDALQLIRRDNRVTLADISQDNLDAAERILNVYGHEPEQKVLIDKHYPFYFVNGIDVFYSSGVLHHMPLPIAKDVLKRTHSLLEDGGEVRLLLHSDRIWRHLTGTVDIYEDPQTHPQFKRFVRRMDAVGYYADWYNEAKVGLLLGKCYRLTSFAVISTGKLCVAILRKR